MSQLIKILKSTDFESKQRQIKRLRSEIAYLSEEVELIELSLNPSNKTRL